MLLEPVPVPLVLSSRALNSIVLGLGLVAAGCDRQSTEPAQPQASASAEPGPKAKAAPAEAFDRMFKGTPLPSVTFKDPTGKTLNLKNLKGPVLVNLWATWCAPCVKELPTLDRLSQSHDRDGTLGVVAISQDMGPHPSVVAFIEAHKIASLGAYQDSKMSLSGALGAEVLPTSILFDARGYEVWRYVGDLDWTGPEAAKLLSEAGPAQPAR
jgi:thiol-disulfide isomerase/thioredoxin